MSETTARLRLPLLAAGQAQKELAHNEALTLLDLLAQPVVETAGDGAPPAAPAAGQGWIVGPSPTGAWTGHARAFALWSEGGWRFVLPSAGMSAWVRVPGLLVRFDGSSWSDGGIVAAPAGGTVVDMQARTAIDGLLALLRSHGLTAT